MRLFWVLVLIFLTVALGLGSVFILQFDPNQLRPDLETYLEKTLGVEARLGDISIQWGVVLRLRLNFLELREPDKQTLILKARRATVSLDWGRFLKHSILTQSLMLEEPEIFLFRKSDGTWNWPRRILLKEQPVERGGQKGTSWVFELKSSRIRFKNGTLHLHDESIQPPFSLDAARLTASLAQSRADASIEGELSASIQNADAPDTFARLRYEPSEDHLNFQIHYRRNLFEAAGQIRSVSKTPRLEIQMVWRGFDLLSVVPAEWKNKPYATGELNAEIEGIGAGWAWHGLTESFRGKGGLEIRGGRLVNLNLLKELLRSMSELPQLKSLRRFEIPPIFIDPLEGHDTPFEILQAALRPGQGSIELNELRIKQPHYLVEGGGEYGLNDKSVRFPAKLVILEELSDFLVKHEDALDVIKNPQGRLVIPFTYEGILPDAAVKPDMRYLVEKLRKKSSTDEEEEDEEEDED